MLQGSGTLRAKDPVVEVGQVTALWTSRWAVSRLETFHFSKRLHVTWERSTAASLDTRMRGKFLLFFAAVVKTWGSLIILRESLMYHRPGGKIDLTTGQAGVIGIIGSRPRGILCR